MSVSYAVSRDQPPARRALNAHHVNIISALCTILAAAHVHEHATCDLFQKSWCTYTSKLHMYMSMIHVRSGRYYIPEKLLY